ncbi:MAG: hypothetical protein RL250_1381 [Verrucomicrobiota bacterium]
MAIEPQRPRRSSTPVAEPGRFTSSPLYWFLLIVLLVAAGFLLHWRLQDLRAPEPVAVTPPPEAPKVVVKEETKVVVDQTPPPPPPPPPVVMNEPPKPMKPAPVVKEEELKYNRFYKTVSTRLVKAHVGDPARLGKEAKAAHELRASPEAPLAVPSGDSGLRAKIRKTVDEYWANLDPDRCVPHPDAEKFPGAVQEPADRVITAVNLPINRSRWHSTGTYAAPGERITFRISSGDADLGLVARIGCHTDDIVGATKRESWHRFPVICNSVALNKRTVELANPFGGPIYIDVPGGEKNAKSRDQIRVEIVGAVEAPIFILGKTTRAEWENRRLAPAPWAEMVSDHMVVSVPSKHIRELPFAEAQELMTTWMETVDACDWLAAWGVRRSAERVVSDAEISIGWMHSGYPIKCYLDSAKDSVNVKKLKTEGNWGFYHELGHNHQSSLWTYSGYTEVTNNLFSLYCMEKISGKKLGDGHGEDMAIMAAEMALDPKANSASAFHLLSQYYHPVKQFGWKSLRDTFETLSDRRDVHKADGLVKKNLGLAGREVEKQQELLDKEKHELERKIKAALKEKKDEDKVAAEARMAEIAKEEKKLKESLGALAKSDSDERKKDIFVRTWSKEVGHNLGPYFANFNWPYTDSMKTSLGVLKPWMPANFPPAKPGAKKSKGPLFGSKNEAMAGAEEKQGDNNAGNNQ